MTQKLLEKYASNPILRGLVQLVPFNIGSAIDVAVITHSTNIQSKRIALFFSALEDGSKQLSEDDILNDDFLQKKIG